MTRVELSKLFIKTATTLIKFAAGEHVLAAVELLQTTLTTIITSTTKPTTILSKRTLKTTAPLATTTIFFGMIQIQPSNLYLKAVQITTLAPLIHAAAANAI